jgi:hypothetical protein
LRGEQPCQPAEEDDEEKGEHQDQNVFDNFCTGVFSLFVLLENGVDGYGKTEKQNCYAKRGNCGGKKQARGEDGE